MSARALRELERVRSEHGEGVAARKLELVRRLSRASLPSAASVARFHECLAYLRALPDDPRVLAAAVRELERFDRRSDLRREATALVNTGIAGTETRFRFFQPTAAWLCERFPKALAIDWDELDDEAPIEALLPLLLTWAEAQALDDDERPLRARVASLLGRGETDARFLAKRIDALEASDDLRRQIYDAIDPPLVLRPSRATPSRTRAAFPVDRVAYRTTPLSRERPELARAIHDPPRAIRVLHERDGERLVTLAREAMVVRARDLDAFMYADRRDARWIDCGDGLAFACLGVVPEQRLLLEAVYGFLTLRNGVPIGYVLASALGRSCEVAYNVFETFRGGEAAWVYGRVLATLRALFDADTFCVFPYQLGHENEEGLRSGAWWFYQKLGFRPRDRATLALMRGELDRIARRPAHRSSRSTLERLARETVFWSEGSLRHDVPPRNDVIGRFPTSRVCARVSRLLAERDGADRERAVAELSRELAWELRGGPTRSWSAAERLAWKRWVPLLALLRPFDAWSAAEKRALVAVVRAKGGRRESDYVRRFDAHDRLRRSLRAIAGLREPARRSRASAR